MEKIALKRKGQASSGKMWEKLERAGMKAADLKRLSAVTSAKRKVWALL